MTILSLTDISDQIFNEFRNSIRKIDFWRVRVKMQTTDNNTCW